MRLVAVLPLTAAFVVPAVANAHIALLDPPARYSRDHLKAAPCGQAGGQPGDPVTAFAPGETITVHFDEFIGHPGHFRISLSPEGDDAFVDPNGFDDLYVADNVLLDGIEDPDGVSDHFVDVTLPDVECEHCVLQLVQVMTDKPPWGPEGGNDLYYQCADIRIGADVIPGSGAGAAGPTPSEDDPDDGGCAVAGSVPRRTGPLWGWIGLGAVSLGRRRRR